MKKKSIIMAISAVVAVIAIYFLFIKKKTVAVGSPEAVKILAKSTTTSVFPLKAGSTGNEVKKLQLKMNEWLQQGTWKYFNASIAGVKQGAVTGVMDAQTLTNIKAFFGGDKTTEIDYKMWDSFVAEVVIPKPAIVD